MLKLAALILWAIITYNSIKGYVVALTIGSRILKFVFTIAFMLETIALMRIIFI